MYEVILGINIFAFLLSALLLGASFYKFRKSKNEYEKMNDLILVILLFLLTSTFGSISFVMLREYFSFL